MTLKTQTFSKQSFRYTCLFFTTLALLIPVPSHGTEVYYEGRWVFSSDNSYCKLQTLVELKNGNLYTRRSAIVKFFYLGTYNEDKACIDDVIPHRTVYTLIDPYASRQFKQGSSALLQSKSLLNELATLQQLPAECGAKNFYKPSHRVERLLISALSADEMIKLSTDFKDHDNMNGVIDTDGFSETYTEFLTCIDNFQKKSGRLEEHQNHNGIEYLKLVIPHHKNPITLKNR